MDKLTVFSTFVPLPELEDLPIPDNVIPARPPIPDPQLTKLTEEEVFEYGLPLPEEYEDTILQTSEIGHLTIITNRDIGTGSNGTQVY